MKEKPLKLGNQVNEHEHLQYSSGANNVTEVQFNTYVCLRTRQTKINVTQVGEHHEKCEFSI